MKIATISFKIEDGKLQPDVATRKKIITDLLLNEKPELLVSSGWTLDTYEDLTSFADQLRSNKIKSNIFTEVRYALQDSNGIDYHKMYFIDSEHNIQDLKEQIFVTSNEIKKDKDKIAKFNDIISFRTFNVGKFKGFGLCCGEINAIQGRDNITYISSNVKDIIDDVNIVVNPTHDCMANYGTLKAKRKHLSQSKDKKPGIYINSSNWNVSKKIKQSPNNSFMQNVYMNGDKVESVKVVKEPNYVYNIFELEV